MSDKYLTSVIIPVYNEHDYLDKCLTALSNQSLAIDEIIVVDNNTSDGSVEQAKHKFGQVRFISEPRQGIVYARNTGFKAASNHILIKIDADSIVDRDWHQAIVNDFRANKIDGWSGYVCSTELNKVISSFSAWLFNLMTFRLTRLVMGSPMLLGANMAITKLAWEKVQTNLIMRNDIWEDLDVAAWFGKQGLRIMTNKNKLVAISARSGNTSPKRFYIRLFGQPRVFRIHKKYLSYFASLILINIEMVAYLVLLPLAIIGSKGTKRPRPDQY